LRGDVQQVLLVSTRYLSAGSQAVETEQLLPLVVPELPETTEPKALRGYTEFEPEVEKLLVKLMPKAIESEIFSALLEGAAAFHTSQQRAMAAATDNADELGQTLTRVMNRARQDSITTEIMEIVGGAEALRSGK
jgi:F-type H+-transporting ATPase subunit gamma